MSSGKKFSACVYCIHYKIPDTESPCNTCECNEEELFPRMPSQFKTFQSLMATGTKEEYEALRSCLREYYGKPILNESKLAENWNSLGHVNALSAKELREAMNKEEK